MLHKLLQQYLDSVASEIDSLHSIYVEKYEEVILTPHRCNLRIRIRFVDQHLLEINEAAIIFNDRCQYLNYRYHFEDGHHTLIFRYDNSPHHQEVSSFPDHKHTINGVSETEKPSILELINEVKKILGQ